MINIFSKKSLPLSLSLPPLHVEPRIFNKIISPLSHEHVRTSTRAEKKKKGNKWVSAKKHGRGGERGGTGWGRDVSAPCLYYIKEFIIGRESRSEREKGRPRGISPSCIMTSNLSQSNIKIRETDQYPMLPLCRLSASRDVIFQKNEEEGDSVGTFSDLSLL